MAATVTALAPVSNDGASSIALTEPYVAEVRITGVAPILFHRWSNEAVAEKAAAAKNSRAKKTDAVETYLYRCDNGNIGLPGEYLRMAIVGAARYRQDPRSPRKSAMDLYKAGVIALTDLADLGVAEPHYIDRRRVVVQRNAITRERPALREGWEASFQLLVNTPEYIDPSSLGEVITTAGRLIGVGDFRPTFGRFLLTSFEVQR